MTTATGGEWQFKESVPTEATLKVDDKGQTQVVSFKVALQPGAKVEAAYTEEIFHAIPMRTARTTNGNQRFKAFIFIAFPIPY
jgi:hypothetical protein